ncbi:MAG TPA: hypothetical protein VND64_27560, partial [Pirellulales bacterium]|nr:hypothetical protein [Pirellulales bacterium]
YYVRRPVPPPPVPVTGIVTLDGVLLDAARVVFVPIDHQGYPEDALTDTTGGFTLKTYMDGASPATGAQPGSYKVAISKFKIIPSERYPWTDHKTGEEIIGRIPETNQEIRLKPGDGWSGVLDTTNRIEHITPERFGSWDTSGLTAEVTKEGPNNFTFNLVKESEE